MKQKEQIIQDICHDGIVAVIRAENADQAARIVDACVEGGIKSLEITFTVPGASKLLEKLANTFAGSQINLGAGTIMDPETARIAILSGAQYIVCPYLNERTVRLCNQYRVPCMPGAMTIKEVVEALETGVDIIKLFPGEVAGPKMIKAILGPIPQANLMPTGGVDLINVKEWIRAGAVAVGAGGSLIASAGTGDYAAITSKANLFVKLIKESREELIG